jgi:hypothetical protein
VSKEQGAGARLKRAFWDSPWVDEAVARREGRRIGRWLRAGKLPALYFAGLVAVPWMIAPGLLSYLFLNGGPVRHPAWALASLLVGAVLGGMGVAFARGAQLWWSEQAGKTLEGWLLSRQEATALVVTTTGSAVVLAAALSVPGALLIALNAFSAARASGIGALSGTVELAIAVLLGGFAVILAASMATASYFLVLKARLARPMTLGSTVLLLLWMALWLWVERVERGWQGPWENHPARVLFALLVLTPIPHLYGVVAHDWWAREIAGRLPGRPMAMESALVLALLYLVASVFLLEVARRGFLRLRAEPELLEPRPAGEAPSERGEEFYWQGFRNPIWTREIRTRLRSRESAEFIFFASVAVAAAGFLPLMVAGGQLADPLQTAAVVREVFFWISMTLGAFLVLLTPGLTAEAVVLERSRGSLELLLATPLRASEILNGKLLGAVSILLLLLSPSLPLFGLCTLFHGASLQQVLGVYAVLALQLALCAYFGVTASAMHDRVLPAKVQAYVIAFLITSLPGGTLWLLAGLALPSAGEQAGAQQLWVFTPGILTFCGFLIAWSWGTATERLAYVEREP